MVFKRLRARLETAPPDSDTVRREKLRLLSNNASTAIAGNLIMGLVVIASLIHSPIPSAIVILWFGGILATGVSRLLIVRAYRRQPDRRSPAEWLRLITIVSAVMGGLWGLSALSMLANLTVYQTIIGIMMICGVCAGVTVLNGAHRPAMISFVALALTPAIAVFVIKGEVLTYVMALTTLFFFAVVARAGMAIEESIRRSVQLFERNDTLIANLQTSNSILRESREEMRIIADYAYAWESWLDPEGRLLWVNRAVERVTGYTRAECLEMPDYPLPMVHPDDHEAVRRALKSAATVVTDGDFEFRIISKSGDVRWCAAASQPVADRQGGIRGFRASARDITEHKALQSRLYHLADTDALTGVFNRRKLIDLLPREMYRSRRYGVPLSLALFDLDHFKAVNDTYGHAAGDEVLKVFANLVKGVVRQSDILARYGGEEFLLVLPETTLAEAQALTNRLRVMTSELALVHEGNEIRVTVSAGVAQAHETDSDADVLLSRADDALYEAKHTGRNRVVAAATPAPVAVAAE